MNFDKMRNKNSCLSAFKPSKNGIRHHRADTNSKFRPIFSTSCETITKYNTTVHRTAVSCRLILTKVKPLLHMFLTKIPVFVFKPRDQPH